MAYLVLARKYRPQTFEEVVRQEHVTQTLSNAITADRVAHAILFSGPRGTGKTTVARILAKAMNCAANRETPSPIPCNECRSCKEITSGNAADVFEIDGASNNSVEQVRELRENIRYMPAHSPYKIYIIDEVHMLSTAAFNALLKTLEEPPPHVLFFFATTEPHKIPITILSRCQRHDFRRIDLQSITEHMARLCRRENIEIADESLNLIGKEADGSMRDALSLLDQVISGSEQTIPHQRVLDILSVVDRKIIFSISEAIFHKNVTGLLTLIEEIYDRGHDIKKLYADLIEHFRNLLMIKIHYPDSSVETIQTKPPDLLDVPAHEIALMATQTRPVSEMYLSQILDLLLREESAVKFSSQPRIAIEMALIRIARIKPAVSIEDLIEKLDTLKDSVLKTIPSADAAENAPVPGPAPAPPLEPPTAALREVNSGFAAGAARPPADTPAAGTAETFREKTAPKWNPIPPSGNMPDPPSASNDPVRAIPETEPPGSKDDPDAVWSKLLGIFSKNSPSIAACLKDSRLKRLSGRRMEIEVKGNDFNINRIKNNRSIAVLKKTCAEFFGTEMEIFIDAQPGVSDNKRPHRDDTARIRQKAIGHPLVADTIEILGGTVVDVKPLQETNL